MTDYCSKCYCKGNYKRCSETPCFHHEGWVDLVRIARIKNLEQFIRNGVKYGYIAVPDEGDPAREMIFEIMGK